ncbi:hypothetical protein N0V93_005069 [Gnomoniopsis smithogilvyi]|uniref:Uncharacterized protein n=1 Tax=Gnomoniopsis smithogilvyi TaxID=1191159 RepID=A0A9W8YVW2_9PEZI|nr:hypothetical protein N0V93_005069 [Gnomoniopsis smithogilvyi]
MPSVVSHAWIPTKKDASADALKDFEKGGKVLATPGLVHAYQGISTDPNEPNHVELLALWDSIDSVTAAHASPDHKAAFESLGAIEDKSNPAIKAHHDVFSFNNDFAAVAEAPAVMFNILVVPAAQQAELDAAWAEVVKGDHPPGLIAGTHGWGSQEVDVPEIGKGKAFLAVSGWESAAAAEAVKTSAADKGKSLEKFGKPHVRVITLKKVV